MPWHGIKNLPEMEDREWDQYGLRLTQPESQKRDPGKRNQSDWSRAILNNSRKCLLRHFMGPAKALGGGTNGGVLENLGEGKGGWRRTELPLPLGGKWGKTY